MATFCCKWPEDITQQRISSFTDCLVLVRDKFLQLLHNAMFLNILQQIFFFLSPLPFLFSFLSDSLIDDNDDLIFYFGRCVLIKRHAIYSPNPLTRDIESIDQLNHRIKMIIRLRIGNECFPPYLIMRKISYQMLISYHELHYFK